MIPVSRTASKWVTRAVNWLGANKGCYWAWFTKPGVPCLSRCLPLLKPYLFRSPPLSQQRWLFSCVYANKPIIHFSRLPLLFQGRLGCLDTPPPFLSCFSTRLVGNLFQSYTKDWKKNCDNSISTPVVVGWDKGHMWTTKCRVEESILLVFFNQA